MLRTATLLALLLLAPGDPALDERFDDAAALDAWPPMVGAQAGDGPRSEVAFDGGALRLQADAATRVFLARARKVAVTGPALRVSARMKTAGVDPAGGRFRNCNVFVRGAGPPLLALPQLFGDHDWTPVSRSFVPAPGVREIELGLFLSLPGTAWFDDLRVEDLPVPWREFSHGLYDYACWPGDEPDEAQLRRNDELRAGVAAWLGVRDERRLRFAKYPDRETKREWTGDGGNAHVEGDTLHTLWPTDSHEIVHLLARAWGDPPALLAEGLAVHLSGAWQGRPVRAGAAEVHAAGRAGRPSELLDGLRFRALPDLDTYPLAGAFVEWLAEARGKDALRALYGALSNRAPAADNLRVLGERLGQAPAEVDAAFFAWLDSAPR